LCSSYSNSQTTDSVTGNLTNFTGSPTTTTSVWNNAGSVGQQLTCWAGGDPGYCGPNPRVSAWGAGSNVINYSYGTVDLNQVVNINKALSIGGSGVQLSGFNFGFTAKNGNGWDNGQQDYLSAYVKFYGSTGNQIAAYDYTSQTNRRYNWTQFNFSETFATPYAASTMGNAQYGFVGRDNNFWVGPYGPEIMNVNFSLKYTVKPDPCIADPLSSPTCPGYALATVKNSILGSTVSNASVTSFVPTINPASTTSTPGVTDMSSALPQSPTTQTTQQSAPPPPPAPDSNQNPSMAQDNPSQPGPQQAGPAPTSPQPAGGPPPTATASAPPPSSGTPQAGPTGGSSGGPSKLAMSVVKSAQAKEQAIQQAAVQNSAKAFEGSVQNSQASSNLAITMNQDMSSNSALAASQFASQSTQASMQMFMQGPMQSSTQSSQQTNNSVQGYSGTGLSFSRTSAGMFNADSFNNSVAMQSSTQTSSTQQFRNESKSYEADQPPMQVAGFGGLGRAGNPLSDMMNQRMDMLQTNIEQRVDTVKKNVQPNELAGGVDVAAMAQIPKGYEAYSLVVLRDAPFYKPETIYKNQTTVDNARLLRGLTGGSDARHQQMVDSQYQLGN
jgi:hypothetical protein